MQIILDFVIFFAILLMLPDSSRLEQLWRSRLVGRGRMIGNHVNGKPFRGFESLLLRQKITQSFDCVIFLFPPFSPGDHGRQTHSIGNALN